MTNRAERRRRTNNVKRRRAALWRSSNSHYRTLFRRDTFAKQHPFDCGHAQCFTCHTEKVAGIPHPQEVRADDAAEE